MACDHETPTIGCCAENEVLPSTAMVPQPRSKARQRRARPSKYAWAVLRDTARTSIGSKLYNLTLDINELKQQLSAHALERSLRASQVVPPRRMDRAGSILQTVHEYFSVFRNGFNHDTSAAYIYSRMDEHLRLGSTRYGRDMLVEQWRRYSHIFDNVQVTLESAMTIPPTYVEGSQGCIARCVAHCQTVVTHRALQTIFPAASVDPDLVDKLVGHPVTFPLLYHLYFGANGQVLIHDVELSLIEPLQSILQNLHQVATLIQSARVYTQGMIGSDLNMELLHAQDKEMEIDRPSAAPDPRLTVNFLLS